MANITAALVKELREKSGAGMMDCKKALNEVDGDVEEAMAWLRKKGLSQAQKKSGRAAAEGLIGVTSGDKVAAMVEINAETDFVGRNELFQNFVEHVSSIAVGCDADIAVIEQQPIVDGRNVGEQLTHLVATIGENMTMRRVSKLSVNDGVVATYVHNVLRGDLGKIGVLVALESSGDKAALQELGKHIAMHVAAANPQFLTIGDIDEKSLESERTILSDQARASGKPEEIIAKMVEGRLRKYYEEVVLLEQLFVMDTDRKIHQVLADAKKDVGADVTLSGFSMYRLGEGVEKKEDNFADEVASMSGV